jgi:hypothetical protein
MNIITPNPNIANLSIVPDEMIGAIYTQCLVSSDINDVITLTATCHRFHLLGTNFFQNLELNSIKNIKLKNLHIIDACPPHNLEGDSIKINLFAVLKACKQLTPHIENNGNLALMVLRRGTTFNQLLNANSQMKGCVGWTKILSVLGERAIENTCVGLMSCNVISGTRDKNFHAQREIVESLGCVIPPIYPYLAVCTVSNGKNIYPQDPLIYGTSSTQIKDCFLVSGACDATLKRFAVMGADPQMSAPHRGAGAWLPL